MLNRVFFLLLAGWLFAGGMVTAAAQDSSQEIRKMLEQRDLEIKRTLGTKSTFTEQQREQLKGMINDVINFEAMGRGALGTHWNTLNAQQRTEFVNVFSSIVRNQSLSNLDIYRSKVTYDKITVSGNTARVQTTTVYKNTPTKVEYVLGRGSQEWNVQDIILDGVSTVDGYARSFQSVIRKKGFDALMDSLRKKAAQVG